MQFIGIAECLSNAVAAFGGGNTIETDFWNDPDRNICVIHQIGSSFGNDVGKTLFNEGVGALSTTPLSRHPYDSPLRFPNKWSDVDGVDYLNGGITNGAGDCYQWYFGGPSYPTWYRIGKILSAGAAPYDWIANAPECHLAADVHLLAPEITGGIAFAKQDASSGASFDDTRSAGVVIPGGGNGRLIPYKDHIVLHLGLREPSRFCGEWYTSIATAKKSDLLADHNNPAIWTIHKDDFAIGDYGVNGGVCDPSPLDGANGARYMLSHAQREQLLCASIRSWASIYDELIARAA